MNKLTRQDTFNIAKAFFHIQNAHTYFTAVAKSPEVPQGGKDFARQMITKLSWCMSAMNDRLSPEGRKHFKEQVKLADTLQFDSIFDIMVSMTPEQREGLEMCAHGIKSGEIKLVHDGAEQH
jgi:hypothetical protein